MLDTEGVSKSFDLVLRTSNLSPVLPISLLGAHLLATSMPLSASCAHRPPILETQSWPRGRQGPVTRERCPTLRMMCEQRAMGPGYPRQLFYTIIRTNSHHPLFHELFYV